MRGIERKHPFVVHGFHHDDKDNIRVIGQLCSTLHSARHQNGMFETWKLEEKEFMMDHEHRMKPVFRSVELEAVVSGGCAFMLPDLCHSTAGARTSNPPPDHGNLSDGDYSNKILFVTDRQQC